VQFVGAAITVTVRFVIMKGTTMHLSTRRALWLILSFATAFVFAHSEDISRDRAKIPDKYKWNLSDIYASDDAWKAAKEDLVARLPMIERYRGKLAESPAQMLGCFELLYALSKDFARISVYAGLSSDIDTRDAARLAMTQEISQIGSDFAAKEAYVDPEILAMGKAKVDAFLTQEPKLQVYRHPLTDLLRRKAHTGTVAEEKVIADASLMSDTPGSIYSIFSNAEFPFPTVTLSNGDEVRLDKAAFNKYRETENREDRKRVFAAYMAKLQEYKRTFGTQIYAEVKKDMFFARARKYPSALESALDNANISPDVYRSLIKNVNSNLATFHRYLRLRQRMLGVDQLHYYDLYAPVVHDVNSTYSFEDADKIVLAAVAPLGESYTKVAERAFRERWFDVYPNDGKVAGAYSNGGVYDVHPYMLLNYNGKYNDVSTLAHELGHTMHSHLSNSSQPYPTARYTTFVAEVASTFNEALLLDHMLKSVTDDDARLALLSNYLDGIRGTLFRQTQFAEFELQIHEMAERGETLTGDGLSDLYLRLTRAYYGHDKNVCVVDDEIKNEWMNVPHFYYNFYVFQYATSLTASAALSEQVLAGDKAATARYITLLKAGGSEYPITLLKDAGVDMTTPAPFDLVMKKINRVMDEMEKILDKKTGQKGK
jgi:oligoendopeptidase F